jgi:hypothetical protein
VCRAGGKASCRDGGNCKSGCWICCTSVVRHLESESIWYSRATRDQRHGPGPACPLLPASRRWIDVFFDVLHAVESSGAGRPLKPIIIWGPDTAGARSCRRRCCRLRKPNESKTCDRTTRLDVSRGCCCLLCTVYGVSALRWVGVPAGRRGRCGNPVGSGLDKDKTDTMHV